MSPHIMVDDLFVFCVKSAANLLLMFLGGVSAYGKVVVGDVRW